LSSLNSLNVRLSADDTMRWACPQAQR